MENVYVRRNRFSERLKAKRAEVGLGQVAFAKLLGIAQPTLAKYEMCKREPDLDGLMNICERLNTTPNEMLGFEPPPQPPGNSVNSVNHVSNKGALQTGDNSPVVHISGNGNNVTLASTPRKRKSARSQD